MYKVVPKIVAHQVKTADNLPLFHIWATERIKVNDPKDESTYTNANEHKHANMELTFIKSGEGELKVDEKIYHVKAGDLILIRNLEDHRLLPLSDTEWLGSVDLTFTPTNALNFSSDFFSPALIDDFYQKSSGNSVFSGDNESVRQIGDSMCRLEDEFLREKPNLYFAKALFMCILSQLSEMFLNEKDDKSSVIYDNDAELIGYALEYISKHLTEDFSLEMLASEMNMEINYLILFFESIQGMSPWSYVINERVALAVKYLKQRNIKYNIAEIARMSGFKSLTNFNKAFKKRMGMTPTEYRKRYGE